MTTIRRSDFHPTIDNLKSLLTPALSALYCLSHKRSTQSLVDAYREIKTALKFHDYLHDLITNGHLTASDPIVLAASIKEALKEANKAYCSADPYPSEIDSTSTRDSVTLMIDTIKNRFVFL